MDRVAVQRQLLNRIDETEEHIKCSMLYGSRSEGDYRLLVLSNQIAIMDALDRIEKELTDED